MFDSPCLAKVGAGLLKYDNGTYTKHLHKTNIFDGRNSIVINSKTLFAMSHINNLSIMKGRVLLGKTITKLGLMCLAQGHKAVALVRLEPTDTWSRVKHSTTTVNLNFSILKISYTK